MNAAKAIELCYARTMRKYAELGEGVVIRPWQSLRDDEWHTDDAKGDRRFPCLDIRCSPPADREDAGIFFDTPCFMTCAHKADADKDHALISAMFEEVERVALLLFAQWWNQSLVDNQFAYWAGQWTKELGATFSLGGITNGEPQQPAEEDNLLTIGLSQIVAFSRTDI